MSDIQNAVKHFKTIMLHKKLVMEGCFKVGLYYQGITHDLSKFSPSEFLVGVKYFQGDRSPNNAEREDTGYSSAWLHHKGRNRHHFEYWIDYPVRDVDTGEIKVVPAPMPDKYIVEMFMDRLAACKTYQKEEYTDLSPWNYYRKGDISRFLHPHTKELLERLLKMNAVKGEEYTIRYIRVKILKNVRIRHVK